MAAVDQARLRALAADLLQLADDMAPPPPPAPVPVPPPPPPVQAQVLPTALALKPAMTLVFDAYFQAGQAYEREQRLTLMSGTTWKLPFSAIDATKGNAFRVFSGASYVLLVDGVERVTVTPTAGSQRSSFVLPLVDIAPGWHWLDIRSDAGETCVPWVAFLQRGEVAQATMPVLLSSYGLYHRGDHGATVFGAMVPAAFAPITVPYPARETPAFTDYLPRKALVQTDVVPWRPYDLHRTRVTSGVLHTANEQAYYWSSMASTQARYPTLPLLDGPRGKGNAAMVTHLQIGRNGGLYFCDPWRLANVDPDGTVKTLAGWRHPAPAAYPTAKTPEARMIGIELVGDWSAVPEARRGFHELWGLAWDQRTVQQGTGTPIPNPPNSNEPPHDLNPVAFVSDAQMGRVCRIEFDKASHATPAKVSEFITGLLDPWDVVCVDGVLYVSERQANRIVAYDATTGALRRVVVSGAAGMATVDKNRYISRVAAIDVIRAQPCVLPEGLFVQDGWLYFGSIAMGQVRRINLATDELQVIVKNLAYSWSGTNFCKIALSDGTFGPRGTVFVCDWLVNNAGRPNAYKPDGTPWDWAGVADGPGRAWESLGYRSAVAAGQGRLVCGTSSEGIVSHSQALDDPQIPVKTWETWRKAYEDLGLQITHGPGGWGYFGLPMPWGISPEIDRYLAAHGHKH